MGPLPFAIIFSYSTKIYIKGKKGVNVLELEDCEIQVHKNVTKGSLIEVRPATGFYLLVRKESGPLGGTFISTRRGKRKAGKD